MAWWMAVARAVVVLVAGALARAVRVLVALSSSRALNNRQRLFYSVNGLHQPTGEKRQGPFPPNPLSDLLGSLHIGTHGTCK
jgi:hypothetical protein